MTFISCPACPSPADCAEAGQCLNTMLLKERYAAARTAPAAPVTLASPEFAAHPASVANAESWPKTPARPPRAPTAGPAGGVAATINAACETALLAHGGMTGVASVDAATRKLAARDALPVLLATGVNENSARKGVGVWARTVKGPA